MSSVLVLGSGGMAGHVVALYLRENGFDVDTLSANNSLDKDTMLVDVQDQARLHEVLAAKKYDTVVNCIALLVAESEEKKDQAVYLNSYLPHFLEYFFKSSSTQVVHISTDDVFSYNNPPYKENSDYDGQSFYGRSKALGEVVNDKDVTFRMSIVGPTTHHSDGGLFNWFFQQEGEVTGFTEAIWNGVTTPELAKGIAAAIKQRLSGVYNFVPPESISKFELLKLFADTFGLTTIDLKPNKGQAVNKTLTNTRTDFQYTVPDYKTMASEMKSWIENHRDIYQHYVS